MATARVTLVTKARRQAGLRPLLVLTCLLHLAWTLWVVLLVKFPHPLNATSFRLVARIVVWVVPAILYIKLVLREPVMRALSLDRHLIRGLAWGLIGAMIPVSTMIWRMEHGAHWITPHPSDLWFNAIISAPIAEEIYFRGLLFTQVKRRTGLTAALLISSISFVLLHVPYWTIGHDDVPAGLARALVRIFIFGIFLRCC